MELPADAKFCPECGAATARAAPPTRERDPASYTPRHLADRILQSKSALEGERKQVTVLFADVKGSMELAEQVDAEAWHAILDRFFQILADGVHRFEGTVNQYTGDGIMALFGAPIAHEDHAQRACFAALHLTGELRGFAQELRREHGLDFSVRMGLNSGDVVVGKIGDDLRMDYTAQGATVGLAERMEQLAEAERPYLSSFTARLAEGYFELEDLGEFRLKGVSDPVPVFGLVGVGPLRTRLDVSRARGFSRFVGRDDEMAALDAALERALAGESQVVGVVGEAGVGKSRLCEEFLEGARARGIRTAVGHCVSHGKMIPMLLMLGVSRSYFGILEQDGDETARDKVTGRMLRTYPASSEDVAIELDFLGIPDPARPAPPMDAEARTRELLRIARRLQHGRAEPIVLVYEDLQWIDAASESLLDGLIQGLEGPTLILVNFRPEYRAPWAHRPYYQQLPLPPLPAESIGELLDDLLGPELASSELGPRIRERAGGNPFFVAELAIPTSVEAVLAARIDRLPEREKAVLQTAAVIERTFSLGVLERIADLPARDLTDALSRLEDAELVYQAALHPEIEYAFKHPLTHDVAYRSQLGDRRRRLHRALAVELQQIKAALIAHHQEAGEEPLDAARWHHRAAEWVRPRDPGAALRHWHRVRALLEPVAETPESIELRVLSCTEILSYATRAGVPEEDPAAIFAEGRALAARAGDSQRLAMLTATYAFQRSSAGAIAESLRLLEEAEQFAEAAESSSARVFVTEWRAVTVLVTGDLREGLRLFDRTREARHAGGPCAWSEWFGASHDSGHAGIRGLALMYAGSLGEARSEFDRSIQLASEGSELEMAARAHQHRVMLEWFGGDARAAEAHGAQAMELAERVASPRALAVGLAAVAEAHLIGERWSAAVEGYESALETYLRGTAHWAEPQFRAGLAEAYLGAGDVARAQEQAARAVEVARAFETHLWEHYAGLAMLSVLLEKDGLAAREEIEARAGRLAARIDETGAESFRPLLHEERARLAQLLGDDAARELELREAHGLFVEIGATAHAERLARELAR
jgi:class 3 adenylate cyclase/tetratricopeptide (TPR) repeat protein